MRWPVPLLVPVITGVLADNTLAEGRVDFSRDVRPILAQHCWTCHGPDEKTREAELRLDLRASALARKAFVSGDAKASKLVARISSSDSGDSVGGGPYIRVPPYRSTRPWTGC